MRICALDLSLRATGFALAVDGNIIRSELITGGGMGLVNIAATRDRVLTTIYNASPELVIFEEFSFGSKGQALHDIIGMSYSVRFSLLAAEIPFAVCSPSSLKKFVVGRGGSSKSPVPKALVIKYLATKFGHDVDDDNVCDAIGLAYVAMAAVGEWQVQSEAQREVVQVVMKANPLLKRI